MATTDCDVAILGAGPYGLAAAAHLHAANGLEIRLFGDPMSFWHEQMPRGMVLRSPYVASNIADPERSLTLDGYQEQTRRQLPKPVALEQFVDYGRWFQAQTVPGPHRDRRRVARIARNGSFRLDLVDGDSVSAGRVIVAAGIMPFAWTPPAFRNLPPELASHSSVHRDLSRFRGRRVLVIGGGQSALESAALLHELGAEVEVLVRAGRIYFLRRAHGILHQLGPLTRALFAPAEVGPAGISRLVSTPDLYRRLPRSVQDRFSVRSLRPAGAAWLQSRLEGVPMTFNAAVTAAREENGQVELTLADASTRRADHVLLATGYRVDIAGYRFLPSELLQGISRVGGYPRLRRGFESSVPGLHFLGAPSAWSFGPLMRFVAGTEFAAPALTRAVLGGRR
ncbi:MAG TPA: FAD-dependent oxidoreductase [Gaiellaceae bacterium]|jgi:cation diffusion facilitator CzcD-associated flavoprotein CzcO|nr:FAD-dependent oxidoreductase [Gaiellaceae bacterium]